ncbi:hypothetical protein [Candidatus Nitronereus thalassa]|uniref:Uncharacterized protein n=1 Tax=Candidatus Nitronereus thalassa TaxID=3020898 RepID=A0ABU3KC48_9BACT|nr:hypothetical protein [Candidatus Nitronereus thalassa]MDT7043752.1 hypothetical protein [Candidatus Nitronereus thalassa]
MIATFFADLWMPIGVAGGVPYVLPVLLAAFLPVRSSVFAIGLMCSFLTIGGFVYSPQSDPVYWKGLANRGLALFAIWVTATLAYYQNKFRDQREEAFKRIQMLEGVLPICMSCKKIRDEGGNWQQLESYISQRSQARFSHGYCSECGTNVIADIKQKYQKAP